MKKRLPSSSSAARREGLIIAAFGRHYEVLAQGERLQCYPRGKKSVYACGDEVDITPGGDAQGVIEQLRPRRSLLWRSDAFRQKLIAANLSHVCIVVATEPGFSPQLISRCIAAAEHEGIRPLIILNKADLLAGLDHARALLAPFAALGYDILELSALEGGTDIDQLANLLADKQAIFVGQSGMGKSTLINALLPEARAQTGEISTALDSGRHTTTFARLYPLDAAAGNQAGGWIIDSPGLQVFGLAHLSAEQLAHSFIEFRPLLGDCRFRDCRHEAEPGCALLAALAAGDIDSGRFEHFRSIRAEIANARQLNPGW